MKIEILFPETCCLFGDLENARYLAASCGGEIINTALNDRPYFADETPDLLYIGSATEKGQERAVTALAPYKDRISELMESGANILATGNALELFGARITGDDGADFPALGLFDYTAKREMKNRYNALYLGKFEDMDIVGFKSQFAHAYDFGELPPLFDTVRGDGRCRGDKNEGVRIKNFMATYLLGPIMILNPDFAKYTLKLMGVNEPTLRFEAAAYEAYERRLSEFTEPGRNFTY